MVHRRIFTLPGIFLLIFVSACSNFGGADSESLPPQQSNVDMSVATAPAVLIQDTSGSQVQRLVINNGDLSLVVEDVEATINDIRAYTEEIGGWIVQSNLSASSRQQARSGSITVRVPADQFVSALDAIKAMAEGVSSESVIGQDVTAEFTDLNSQISNLQAAEQQLQQIMDNADETEDVLAVYSELVRIRGEIEVAQGRVNYLTEAAAYSAIHISIGTDPEEIPLIDDSWQPANTFERALSTLAGMFRGIVDILIYGVVVGVPLLIFVVVPLVVLYRRAEPLVNRFMLNTQHRYARPQPSPENVDSAEHGE